MQRSMRKLIYKFFIAISFAVLWLPYTGAGQNTMPQFTEDEEAFIFFDLTKELDQQLLPLDSLIKHAMVTHPTVLLNKELAFSAEQRLALATKTWTNMLSAFANYSYGNQSLITSGALEGDMLNIANGYRIGVNLNVPLSEFTMRKNRINLEKHEIRATQFKTSEMGLVIANQVTEEYYNLLLAQRLMLIRQNMQENARNNLSITELEYKAGNLDIRDYTRMMEIETLARTEFERVRRDFLLAYNRLEILLGAPLVAFHVVHRK